MIFGEAIVSKNEPVFSSNFSTLEINHIIYTHPPKSGKNRHILQKMIKLHKTMCSGLAK
ncbi:hypothetical protein HanPI659440_Chr03g0117691 [Helianthus annuus]|nr:hypothetical protein HanPI659440_Chr03g0117691 [Helianthus annuus]